MDKVLTITVPSYNTEAYIDQCLPTMLKHPRTSQMEVLLINDGSTDGTLKKMRWYEKNYPDTVLVVDKENGGHGSAINVGIQKARGAYFKVVDGDDWVVSENLGKMVRQLESCRADLVIHPYIKYHACKKRGRAIRYNVPKGRTMLFDEVAPGLREVEIHASAYRTGVLRDNGIRVRENCFYEDTEYNIFPIRYVDTVYACSDPVYVYRIGMSSQSIAPRRAFQNRKMHHMVIEDCISYYEENSGELSEAKREYIRRIIRKRIRSQYMIYLKNPMTRARMQELEEWDLRLRERSPLFYWESDDFPVSALRKHMRWSYPSLKFLYGIYRGLSGSM